MYDYLISHAATNVWCTPDQDRQIVFAPTRISKSGGIKGTVPVLWDDIALPTPTDIFHVYQIGQVSPGVLNLLPAQGIWTLVAENMKDNNLICDIYTINGIQLPRIETYILVNRDRNVLIAIKDQKPLVDLSLTTQPLFLRLYSNAYFESTRDSSDFIDVYGMRVTSQTDTLNLQHKYQALQLLKGLVSAFVNGTFVDTFNPNTVAIGTVVEFVYDSTVKRVVEFPVSQLPTFNSTRDSKVKYLLHYAGLGDGIIDYLDDIDVYLINRNQVGPVPAFKGVYYHKNSPDAMRMVTHKDYSITVPYVVGYATATVGWGNPQNLIVRLHIRNSGYARPLVSESSRIVDLYKLPDIDLVNAMIGTNATVPAWQAQNLENSDYVKIMGVPSSTQITIDLVESAYGYDAIARALADTPQTVNVLGNIRVVDLPYGLQANSTVYEYDSNGYLLGNYQQIIGYAYQCNNPTAALVEVIAGNGTSNLTTQNNVIHPVLVSNQNYRFYVAPMQAGNIIGPWIDVTSNSQYYTVANGIVTWVIDTTLFATMVRDDITFLAYNYQMTPSDGIFRFDITSTEIYGNSNQGINAPMRVPPGKLELWLNGRAIIENVDYFVEWPQVCIVNTNYLIANTDGSIAQQTVSIRGTGFCNSDLSRPAPADVGFVEYGMMSRNNYYNVRDDKVLRMVVNGAVWNRTALLFSEDNPSVGMVNVPNGSPYIIDNVLVPLRGHTLTDTYTLLGRDQAIDTEVQNYLSQYLTDPLESNPDAIPTLYAIYSPFCAKVMYDLLNGVLSVANFMGQYSDLDVQNYINSMPVYTDLLTYEPVYKSLDFNHLIVHPHNRQTVVTLNIYQYNFLARVVEVFLNSKVDLSHFVAILPTYI